MGRAKPLRDKAALCRRLLKGINDPEIIRRLTLLAKEFEAAVAAIDTGNVAPAVLSSGVEQVATEEAERQASSADAISRVRRGS